MFHALCALVSRSRCVIGTVDNIKQMKHGVITIHIWLSREFMERQLWNSYFDNSCATAVRPHRLRQQAFFFNDWPWPPEAEAWWELLTIVIKGNKG
jgi:hypothetical protein